MRPARRGGWRVGLIAGLCGLAGSGCATLDRTADTFMTPVKYAWAGAGSGLRTNLERGLAQLEHVAPGGLARRRVAREARARVRVQQAAVGERAGGDQRMR